MRAVITRQQTCLNWNQNVTKTSHERERNRHSSSGSISLPHIKKIIYSHRIFNLTNREMLGNWRYNVESQQKVSWVLDISKQQDASTAHGCVPDLSHVRKCCNNCNCLWKRNSDTNHLGTARNRGKLEKKKKKKQPMKQSSTPTKDRGDGTERNFHSMSLMGMLPTLVQIWDFHRIQVCWLILSLPLKKSTPSIDDGKANLPS